MKTVIEMAREAGWKDLRDYDSEMRHDFFMCNTDSLERLVELARADEREACAKVCDELANDENTDEYINGADWCSVRIRARSNT
jgi:hypothetical protein